MEADEFFVGIRRADYLKEEFPKTKNYETKMINDNCVFMPYTKEIPLESFSCVTHGSLDETIEAALKHRSKLAELLEIPIEKLHVFKKSVSYEIIEPD